MNKEIGPRLNRLLNPPTVKHITEDERLRIEAQIERLGQEIELARSQQLQNSTYTESYNPIVISRDKQNE